MFCDCDHHSSLLDQHAQTSAKGRQLHRLSAESGNDICAAMELERRLRSPFGAVRHSSK